MGGGRITPRCFVPEEGSSITDDSPQLSSSEPPAFLWDDNLSMEARNGTFVDEELAGGGASFSPASLDFEETQRRKRYREVLQSYDQLRTRLGSLSEAKTRILSYTPGAWIENDGCKKLSDYDVPEPTCLILIGTKGSGKSSLINRISKVLEVDKFASDRAQVTYNSSLGDGTYFLQEYMIPRGSKSFCLYDTRSLSDDTSDNIDMIKHWITKGVCHGELVIRKFDSSNLRNRMKCKARENVYQRREVRMVNFCIFVVDGLAILKSMRGDSDADKQYTKMIATTFNCPYLSFRDDKPVVAVTHGDLLSLTDRARVRTQLGQLLGVPPATQIFDIPESCDPGNELIIVDMLRYCLEHADRNLRHKNSARIKVFHPSLLACIHLFIILGIVFISIHMRRAHICHAPKANLHIDWHAIRHLWLE